jgi:DNA-binding NarL/FixJ family response regulator
MAQRKAFVTASDSNPLPFKADEWNAIIVALDVPSREAKVVEHVVRGLRDKHIAAALGIGITTVRTNLRRTFTRLGVSDRMELVLHVFATARRLKRPLR